MAKNDKEGIMAGMRSNKIRLKALLAQDDWREHLPEIAAGGMASVPPLISFLKLDPAFMHRAACALGATVARLASANPEAARNIIRQFMWHMNEDSGNIGWGIPDAFAECLAASPMLADTYASILISYIMDLGHADNYCDHDLLRRSCYWAIGRLAQARPDLAEKARPWLLKGLEDGDSICRGMAAWALSQLPSSLMDVPALKKLAQSEDRDSFEIFDGAGMISETVAGVAAKTFQRDCALTAHN